MVAKEPDKTIQNTVKAYPNTRGLGVVRLITETRVYCSLVGFQILLRG